MKKRIAIITGGNVSERGISLKSARTVQAHMNKDRYEVYVIELEGTDFLEQDSRRVIDKNDFSYHTPSGEKIVFDLVYPMLHGHPAEDGCLQGYLELLEMPYVGCDAFVSALTFNKQACKNYLRPFDVPMARSILLFKNKSYREEELKELGLPLFVKPNKNGSSYGVSKVKEFAKLKAAIDLAFQYDEEVLVEQFLFGREYSCGVLRTEEGLVVLPITAIIPKNEFFDFEAKYKNESDEITPAPLSESLTRKAQEQSRYLYQVLNCKGIVRFDYILVEDTFYFLEVNTIPGFSEQSIVPQQALAFGWSITELLDKVIDELSL